MNKLNGFLYGLLSSASFGLIPMFTIPVMREGMQFPSVLVYRFTIATVALGILLLIRKESFRITRHDLPRLLLLSVFYLASSLFLIWGYEFMPSGIATTLHFMYPVLTTLIMMMVFHEKKSIWRMIAIALAVAGVYLLSVSGESGQSMSLIGLIIVLLSALGYALYLVAIKQLDIRHMKGLKLTFYVFLFTSLFLVAGVGIQGGIQPISSGEMAANLILLAIIPTIVSNLALVQAIKHIGSTLTSVLGAMEPLTAVCVGILMFGEPLTLSIAAGVILILSAVTIIIAKQN